MHQRWFLAVVIGLIAACAASAQTPGIIWQWQPPAPGSGYPDPGNSQGWVTFDDYVLSHYPGFTPNYWGDISESGASGDLVITEKGTGAGSGCGPNPTICGAVGGPWFLSAPFDRARELSLLPPGTIWAKGHLDATGLDYIELDLKRNSKVGVSDSTSLPVVLNLLLTETDNEGFPENVPSSAPFDVSATGITTLRIPLAGLTKRQVSSVKSIYINVPAHTSMGNLSWTISQVRTVGTPLTERNIVTNDAGTPDNGIDGAFILTGTDALAVVGNSGAANQVGLSRNPAGSGSLQWTDKGGTGDLSSPSGAAIGWGNGSGWRASQQPDFTDPSLGNSYNERLADFSNYNRMTVKISAQDVVNPSGTVGVQAFFGACNPDGSDSQCNGSDTPAPPPFTVMPSQNLVTDGQYHDMVFDLSSVTFLKDVWHWGLDMAAHPNNITFNIDNIRLWNSNTPQGVPGDYNGNGVVDAADYVLWRNGGALQNEGATPGSNTPEDYTYWRSRFGATSGSGAAVAAAVPEPSAVVLMFAGLLGSCGYCRGR